MLGTKYAPDPPQRQAIRHGVSHAAAAFLLPPGFGKTSVILAILKILLGKRLVKGALIIAPRRVVYLVWLLEVAKWLDFHDLSVGVLHGKKKDKVLLEKHDVYLMNPEGTMWLINSLGHTQDRKGTWRYAKKRDVLDGKRPFNMLAIDESTKFKRGTSQRHKALRQELKTFKRRYLLTGTPAPRGLLDLWGQFYLLDGGHALGRFYTHYRNRFFYPVDYMSYEWRLIPGEDKTIYELLKPLTFHLPESVLGKLPRLETNKVFVELGPEARATYEEMRQHALIRWGAEHVISAEQAASVSNKLRQLTGGVVYDDNRVPVVVHTEKLDALEELLGELQGQPALIAFAYTHERDFIKQRIGKNTPVIDGSTSEKRADEICEAWNRGELARVLVQPDSTALGLNLQAGGCNLIWYSLTWDLEKYDQLIRRLRRRGQKAKRVRQHQLLARHTVDERVGLVLHGKAITEAKFLAAVRRALETDENSWD